MDAIIFAIRHSAVSDTQGSSLSSGWVDARPSLHGLSAASPIMLRPDTIATASEHDTASQRSASSILAHLHTTPGSISYFGATTTRANSLTRPSRNCYSPSIPSTTSSPSSRTIRRRSRSRMSRITPRRRLINPLFAREGVFIVLVPREPEVCTHVRGDH